MKILTSLLLASLAASCATPHERGEHGEHVMSEASPALPLGSFSVSLAVKDIAASHAFYKKLGFEKVLGGEGQNWLILRLGTTTIGLFQGLFENNIMTFNPGWNAQAQPVAEFEDVRDLQARFEAAGVTLMTRADPASTGPANFTLADPDGNMILFDQHVPR